MGPRRLLGTHALTDLGRKCVLKFTADGGYIKMDGIKSRLHRCGKMFTTLISFDQPAHLALAASEPEEGNKTVPKSRHRGGIQQATLMSWLK